MSHKLAGITRTTINEAGQADFDGTHLTPTFCATHLPIWIDGHAYPDDQKHSLCWCCQCLIQRYSAVKPLTSIRHDDETKIWITASFPFLLAYSFNLADPSTQVRRPQTPKFESLHHLIWLLQHLKESKALDPPMPKSLVGSALEVLQLTHLLDETCPKTPMQFHFKNNILLSRTIKP